MPAPRVRDLETARKLIDLRREIFNEQVKDLAAKVHNGQLTIVEWRTEMRQAVKDLHTTTTIIARGARENVSFSDWGRVGRRLRDQYGYLTKFAQKLETGAQAELAGIGNFPSEDYIAARSQLYGGNTNATFWSTITYGLLPQVPGDGQTVCLTNCGCTLRIEDSGDSHTVHVFWVINPALENCPDCQRLTGEWNPYVVTLPAELVIDTENIGLNLVATLQRVVDLDRVEILAHLGHRHAHEHVA